jgi:hypothetical protein
VVVFVPFFWHWHIALGQLQLTRYVSEPQVYCRVREHVVMPPAAELLDCRQPVLPELEPPEDEA